MTALARRWWRPVVRFAMRRVAPDARNSLAISLMLDGPDRAVAPIAALDETRVMVLAPHADDEAIGCGGAIALHARRGARVTVVVVTDGALGSRSLSDAGLSDEARRDRRRLLIARRQAEARTACERLGAATPTFLGAPDGALRVNDTLTAALGERLRVDRPQLVYAPFVIDQHGDHWQTNRLLAAALRAEFPDRANAPTIRGYEVWAPLLANRVLDISDVVDVKHEAIRAYASQLADRDYLGAVAGLNRYRALLLPDTGERVAEAFHQTSTHGFLALMDRVAERRDAGRRPPCLLTREP